MRLFLASYRFGAHYEKFAELVGAPGRIAVIGNACDAWPAAREAAMTSEFIPLRRLGFTPEEIDLREFIDRRVELVKTLSAFPALWVRGGNTFVLRAQFARSGADTIVADLLASDALVYAGYSAGACLLAPDLHGLESMDDPAEVRPTCGIDPLWTGLGLIDRPLVVHFNSPTDPEGHSTRLAAYYRSHHTPHYLLTDKDAITMRGNVIHLYE